MAQQPAENRFEILTQHDVHIVRELTGFIFDRARVKTKPVLSPTRRKIDFREMSFRTRLDIVYGLAHILAARNEEIFYLEKIEPDQERPDDLLVTAFILDAKRRRFYVNREQGERVEVEAMEYISEKDEIYASMARDLNEFCLGAGVLRPETNDFSEFTSFLETAGADNKVLLRNVVELESVRHD
ncbi:MAG: hypothetical protein M3P98_03000 [bacterium]|nr:hypothetical protein [bacterium]